MVTGAIFKMHVDVDEILKANNNTKCLFILFIYFIYLFILFYLFYLFIYFILFIYLFIYLMSSHSLVILRIFIRKQNFKKCLFVNYHHVVTIICYLYSLVFRRLLIKYVEFISME